MAVSFALAPELASRVIDGISYGHIWGVLTQTQDQRHPVHVRWFRGLALLGFCRENPWCVKVEGTYKVSGGKEFVPYL